MQRCDSGESEERLEIDAEVLGILRSSLSSYASWAVSLIMLERGQHTAMRAQVTGPKVNRQQLIGDLLDASERKPSP